AVRRPVLPDLLELDGGLLAGHRPREVLHDFGIAVHRRKRVEVLGADPAEEQTGRAALGNHQTKPDGCSSLVPRARSRAMPTVQRVPSSQRWPMSETPEGILRGGETGGCCPPGGGSQSLRMRSISTKPAGSTRQG